MKIHDHYHAKNLDNCVDISSSASVYDSSNHSLSLREFVSSSGDFVCDRNSGSDMGKPTYRIRRN